VVDPVPSFGFVNQPPVVIPGTYDPIIIPNGEFDFIVFSPTVTDDGIPGTGLTFLWSVDSGPGAVVFDNNTDPNTAAHFSVGGTYVLRLTASDGNKAGTATTTITIVYNNAPVVNAGADGDITLSGGTATFTPSGFSLTDDGIPVAATVTWSKVSGPADVAIDDPNVIGSNMHFTAAGTYVMQLDATDTMRSAAPDTITVVVHSEVVARTVTVISSGTGCIGSSSPSGISFNDVHGGGPASHSFSHSWNDGTVVTLTFSTGPSGSLSYFKVNGSFHTPVTVTPPDVGGGSGVYSYTFTVSADISIEFSAVPVDF
jgi:K319-like protein